MQNNIILGFFQPWDATVLLKNANDTGAIMALEQSSGLLKIQVDHTHISGSPTLKVDVEESVDGVSWVLTQVVAALAKDTTTLYDYDCGLSRFARIKITENNVSDTAVTLSVSVR